MVCESDTKSVFVYASEEIMQAENNNYIRMISFGNESWNEYVDSIAGGFVFYRSEYISAFIDIDHYPPIMLIYECGEDRAIYVSYKRDVSMADDFVGKISAGVYFDLMSPYGYGGYIGSVKNYDLLMKEHHSFCKKEGYVCEVVKFHPLLKYVNQYIGEIDTSFHNVICDLSRSMDEIWMSFKSKVRKNVKRAKEYSLVIDIDEKGENIDGFLKIYYSTMDRNKADKGYYFPRSFFQTINSMVDHFVYFHIYYNDIIVSSELVLFDDKYCYSYLGGTDKEYYHMRPNDLLKYETIKWGHDRGLLYFILGGGHGADDGIFQYKSALAPDGIVDFYVGTDVFSDEKYKELCDVRALHDSSFCVDGKLIPAYRF